MPKFSIVLPTRNRDFIVGHAIRSVQSQAFGDYEFIISDNCSRDRTSDLAAAAARGDRRIRHVHTPAPVSMPASWEFALGHAKGDWILLLEDDGVLVSDALSRLVATIDAYRPSMITFAYWSYFSHDVSEPWRRNTYVTTNYVDDPAWVTSDTVLKSVRELTFPESAPRMYNCVVHHEAIAHVRERLGSLCVAPAPDYSAGAALLATIPRYLHHSRPFLLSHCGKTSPGASMDAYHEFQRELGDDNRTEATPVSLPFVSACNIVPESIGRVQRGLGGPPSLQVSFDAFLQYFSSQLTYFEKAGWDLPLERQALNHLLGELPLAAQGRARARLLWSKARFGVDRKLRAAVWRTASLRRTYERLSKRHVIAGERYGFHDFPGALDHMNAYIHGGHHGS